MNRRMRAAAVVGVLAAGVWTTALAEGEAARPAAGRDWTAPEAGMEFVWVAAMKMWAGRYEVTNAEYRRFQAGHDSGAFREQTLNGDRQPVVQVGPDEAWAFTSWLTYVEGKQGRVPAGFAYRLPTQEEWRTLARCGDKRAYPWGDDWPPKFGNYKASEAYDDGVTGTCPVEESGGNDWGLFGVGGNAAEFVLGAEGFRACGGSYRTDKRGKPLCEASEAARRPGADCGFRVVLGVDGEADARHRATMEGARTAFGLAYKHVPFGIGIDAAMEALAAERFARSGGDYMWLDRGPIKISLWFHAELDRLNTVEIRFDQEAFDEAAVCQKMDAELGVKGVRREMPFRYAFGDRPPLPGYWLECTTDAWVWETALVNASLNTGRMVGCRTVRDDKQPWPDQAGLGEKRLKELAQMRQEFIRNAEDKIKKARDAKGLTGEWLRREFVGPVNFNSNLNAREFGQPFNEPVLVRTSVNLRKAIDDEVQQRKAAGAKKAQGAEAAAEGKARESKAKSTDF